MPAVSVVVPAYNVERYLGNCVGSLCRQSFRDVEIIVVDDGSTDRSLAIAERCAAADNRVKVVSQTNRGPGPGGGRNGGLESASGEFVMFVDGDDVVPREAVELLLASMQGNPDVTVSTGGVRRLAGSRVLPSRLHDRSHNVAKITTLAESPELVFDPTAWNKLFRRTHFDRTVGGFPEQVLYEDMVASMASFTQSPLIAVLSEPVYLWRIRQDGSSITQQPNWRDQLDRFGELRRLVDLVRASCPPHIKDWLDWKIISLDLAYTHGLLAELGEDDGRALFEAANRLLDDAAVRPTIALSSPVRRRHDALRSGDYAAYRNLIGRERRPIRPDRRPVDAPAVESIDVSVLRISGHRGEIVLDLRIPKALRKPTLAGSSPAPLAGGRPVWDIAVTRRSPRWVRVRLPVELVVANRGETHLAISGLIGDRAVRGELERSHLDRARSMLCSSPAIAHGRSICTTFFEDAQLHLWSGSPDPAIAAVTVDAQAVAIRVHTGTATAPPALALASVRGDHTITARLDSCDTAGSRYVVAHEEFLPGHAYALAALNDLDDPGPTPLETLPSALGRHWSGARRYLVRTGERGQTVIAVTSPAALGRLATGLRARLGG